MNATVSILAYQNLDKTTRCLSSVLRSSPMPELILTDNGTTDGTAEYFDSLAARYPNIRVVHNSENLGFIEPNLRALEMTETPYFVMLNNDCVVRDREWIAKLMKPFSSPMAALSAPESCASKLRDDLSGIRCPVEEFEYLEASCLMCRTDLMKKIGLFSPDLQFAYGEDADLSLRVRKLGYTLHCVPIDVQHEGGATAALVHDINRYEVANHSVMIKRWGTYLKARRFEFSIVVKRQGAMGDVLLITPIIDALARKFPESPIWVETQAVDLFLNNPLVRGASRHPQWHMPHIMVDLDMAYENLPGEHIVDAYGHVASKMVGTELDVRRVTTLPIKEDPFGHFFTPGNWAAIHAEPTTWPGKNWPADRWRKVIDWLRAQGMKVVLVGTSKRPLEMPFDLDLREQTAPMDLAAALTHCSLFLGHDSFPMHVAQSQGIPVVGLFGATRAKYILTNGSPAIGIDGRGPCAGARHMTAGLTFSGCAGDCMASIQVDEVKEAASRMMEAIPA